MNINNSSNLSFNAHLDISKMSDNKAFWQKTADCFNLKTKKYSGQIILEELKNDIVSLSFNKYWKEYITQNGSKKFLNMTPDNAADKLVKLFYFVNDNDGVKFITEAQNSLWTKIIQKFPDLKKESAYYILKLHLQNGIDIVTDAMAQKRKIFLEKDSLLKDLLEVPEGGPQLNPVYRINKAYMNIMEMGDK